MKKSLTSFSNKLEEQSINLKIHLKKLNDLFSNQNSKNLNPKESEINSIHFYRSMGYANTNCIFYCYNSKNEIKEVETDLTNSLKHMISEHIEFESFIQEELTDDELDTFFMKCEQKYIQWFAELWHSTSCHLNERVKFVLIENNSGKSFDLNVMEWVDDAFKNQNKSAHFYSKESLFDHNIAMKRILNNYEY